MQEHQRGTGDATRVGLAALAKTAARALVLNGDVPLITGADARAVAAPLDGHAPSALSFATCVVDDPTGYGRVLRRGGRVLEVREQRDLRSAEERGVREINAGIYAAGTAFLRESIAALVPNNAQGELYLTDIVAFASNAAEPIATVQLGADVLAGVNDREQLAQVERTMRARIVHKWRLAGVTIRDGASIDAGVVLEPDATGRGQSAVLRGRTRVAAGAIIDARLRPQERGSRREGGRQAVLRRDRLSHRTEGDDRGPFAHLRPDSDIGEDAHVGNFVETKKTRMRQGAKANHLAYLGDSIIGERANVGAGTIFCNYDGFQKHTTVIEEGAFIGSDSQIVAPVTVGANAYVATGTTVTRDVPPGALAVGRVKQENKDGYAPKLRARLQAAKAAKAGPKRDE